MTALRQIDSHDLVSQIAKTVEQINRRIDPAIQEFFQKKSANLQGTEKTVVEILLKNAQVAESQNIPLCQDTGLMVVFAKVGVDVHLEKPLSELINEGVRLATVDGYLRASVVADPLHRVNTKDNTPAILHIEMVEGDRLELDIMAKGGGSENASAVKMLTPGEGREGIIRFVVDQVSAKGANCCPPLVIGVGIGGNLEMSSMLAKKAIIRGIGSRHPLSEYNRLEEDILKSVNELNIGAGGFGGRLTAMDVLIETTACHIASLPVAVNLGCNSTRHGRIVL